MRHLRVAALVMSILLVGVLAVLAPAAQAHPQRHVHPRPSPSPSVSLLPSVPPSPSLSPSLSASASSSPTGSPLINCWPTPHTCGYPDASNTGVPAGHTLTTVNGDVMLSTPGQVYQDREVNGCVNVTATGVTIQFVKVHCSSVEAISHFDLGVRDSTPLKVLDSEVDCLGTVGVTGIGDTNVDAERDDISQCENGFDLDQWDTVRDNYVHNLLGEAGHTDGAQLAHYLNGCSTSACEVSHSRLVTIQHNTITGKNDAGANGTSAIISNPAGDESLVVDGNLLDGGAFTLYCDHQGTADSNSFYTNNRFGRSAAYGPATGCSDEAHTTGNVYDDDDSPIPLG